MNRGARLTVALAVSAAMAGGGWLAGRRITSPDAAARDAAPPPAANITVPVEARLLSTNVVTRGSVRYDEGTNVHVAKATATAGIVTRGSPDVGSTLAEGALVVEVDSRPAFAFTGELPAYRDLTPGIQGDDVRQMQAALTRLGVFAGTVDGIFGASTQDAVSAYWRKMGYEPRPPSKAERDAVTESQRRVDTAKETVRQATTTLDKAAAGPRPSERMQLDAAVNKAVDDLARTRAARQGAIAEANDAASDATLANAAAVAARAAANAAAEAARAGTNPDTGAPVTATELSAFERAASEAELAARRAQRALDDAKAKAAAMPGDQDALIGAAQEAVDLAKQTLAEALTGGDTATLKTAVADAKRALADAEQTLAEATAAAGVVVPESELVFLKQLPRRVDQSSARRGETLPDQVIAVSGTDLVIDASVSAADRKFVRKDAKVKLDEQSLGVAMTGTVTFVADQPGAASGGGSGGTPAGGPAPGSGSGGASGGGGATDRFAVRILPDALPDKLKPTDLRGISLRITIPVQSTNGKVTAVPVAAVTAGGDGSARVDVETTAGGPLRTVSVRTGLSAQGFVEVTALGTDTLKVGDRVVVGKKQKAADATGTGSGSGGASTSTTASGA